MINENVQGTKELVRDREKFEIEEVRDRESILRQLLKVLLIVTSVKYSFYSTPINLCLIVF